MKPIKLILLTMASGLVLAGCSSSQTALNNVPAPTAKATPLAEPVQQKFEAQQQVSEKDDSMATLEKEVKGTVIQNEDFSELQKQ